MLQYIETLHIDMFQYITYDTYQYVMFQYVEIYQYVVFQYIETNQYVVFQYIEMSIYWKLLISAKDSNCIGYSQERNIRK